MAILDPDLLLRAYSIGVFPMADSRDARDVYWVEPKKRAILPIKNIHLSHSLRKTIRSGRFEVTRDAAFPEVLRECAARDETWINAEIEASYVNLHTHGHAHSVECWRDGVLAGGLYGVTLGGAFFGESMFSNETDASKVALAWLVARLKVGGYKLLDCQFMTDHLRSLGAIEIDQKDYLSLLSEALAPPPDDAPRPEFAALERLLDADSARTVDAAASGCVIVQLLGQTS